MSDENSRYGVVQPVELSEGVEVDALELTLSDGRTVRFSDRVFTKSATPVKEPFIVFSSREEREGQ